MLLLLLLLKVELLEVEVVLVRRTYHRAGHAQTQAEVLSQELGIGHCRRRLGLQRTLETTWQGRT